MKFGRVYNMVIDVSPDEVIEITEPLTLTFDIRRNTLASANSGHFRIYNLAPDTRRRIFHDRNQSLSYQRIRLQAGYQDQSPLPQIFLGNLQQAYSYRQGTDWVTEIEAFDGGFGILNGQVAQTIPSGWNLRQILTAAIGTMANTQVGAIGDVETGSTRGITLMGNSWDVVNGLTAGKSAKAFIDGETAHVLKRNEYIAGQDAITLISSETGLLQTPRRSDQYLEATILFEPRLQVGQQVHLECLEAAYNGTYKCLGVTHRGTISGAVGGDCVTVASLDLGTATLVAITAARNAAGAN